MSEIGRPKKVRYIQSMPKIVQFSPRGRPGRPEGIELSLDEFEAVKLADFQDFSQADGAQAMRISRPSFGRILRSGRHKIADALVNGKIIRIVMGTAQLGIRKVELSRETFAKEIGDFENKHQRMLEEMSQLNQSAGKGDVETALEPEHA